MFQKTFLTGLALAVLAAQACGSDDGKKKATGTDAGAAGEAGTPAEPSPGGAGGTPAVPLGGAAGETPIAGGVGGFETGGVGGFETGGAGGEPSLPEPELLFSVKPGAVGLAGTAISGEENAQNFIYTSSTGSQDRVNGANAVKVDGAKLGLVATDQIVSFALLQPEPQHPMYLFTLADGSEGAFPSRTKASWLIDGDEESNLYYSDGVQSHRGYVDEGGDEYGYNALFTSEVSIGLSPGAFEENIPDDLTGLAAHDARFPITELYFTVGSAAVGAVDSAVATVAADERGCTIFKSGLDGTNSVAFTCAELGLIPTDQIDGLAVLGDDAPGRVVFSVSTTSQGTSGSAVATTLIDDIWGPGATLFESTGDGSNAVYKTDRDLGLGGRDTDYDDEIDGFTIVDTPPPPSVAHAATCDLAYDPFDAVNGGGLSYIGGTIHIGSNVLVLFGQTATSQDRLLAYNATTCAFLQQKDMPAPFDYPGATAAVQLAGWKATQPLDKIEYLRASVDDSGLTMAIRSYDDAGAFLNVHPIPDTYYGDIAGALVHDAARQRLFLVINHAGGANQMLVLPSPKPGDTTLTATFHQLTMPCADDADVTGLDALGNLYLTKLQASHTDRRVCAFTPEGEVVPRPYSWAMEAPNDARGFIVPGGSHFLLRTGDGPVKIERGAYQP